MLRRFIPRLRELPTWLLLILVLAMRAAAQNTTVDDLYFNGTVQVFLEPAEARAAGAGWRVSGEAAFRGSGQKILKSGPVRIEYKPVEGFSAPPDETVSVNRQTKAVTRHARYVRSTASPPAAAPDLHLAVNGTVNVVAPQPNGQVIVGGVFTAVNSVALRNLARINPNGSVDRTWHPDPDGEVKALLVRGDAVYVGGSFMFIGGRPRIALALVSTADEGSAAEAFDAQVLGDFTAAPVVAALASDGSDLFVAGQFASVSRMKRAGLAKVSAATGVADAQWQAGAPAGANSSPYGPIVLDASYVYVAQAAALGALTVPLQRLDRSGAGARDTTWQPALTGVVQSIDVPTFALLLDGDKLLVGGTFFSGAMQIGLRRIATTPDAAVEDLTEIPASVTALAADANYYYLARVEGQVITNTRRATVTRAIRATGALDAPWAPAVIPGGGSVRVNSLVALPAAILCAGSFSLVGADPAFSLVRFDPTTARRDFTFFPTIEAPGEGRAMVRQPDGKLLIGGQFFLAGGLPRRNIVRLNPDGSVDANWDASTDGPVNAIAVADGAVFLGGNFTTAGNLPRKGLARVDAGVSAAVDPQWQADIAGILNFAEVHALAAQGGFLYVGGDFGSLAGGLRNGLGKLRTTGAAPLVLEWDAKLGGSFPGASVDALALSPTHLFAGGRISSAAGRDRNGLARVALDGEGAVSAQWNPGAGAAIERVSALALVGNSLFVGGKFTAIGGQKQLGNLAKLSSTGTGAADPLWKPRANGQVLALAAVGDTLHAGGRFTAVSQKRRVGAVKLSQRGVGTVDPKWDFSPFNDLGAFGTIKTQHGMEALLASSGDVFAAGDFTNIAGEPRNGFALLAALRAPIITQDPNDPTKLYFAPAPGDESAVSYFQIAGLTGGTLLRADGTPVVAGEYITVEEGAQGITIAPAANASTTPMVQAASAGEDVQEAVGAATTQIQVSLNGVPPVLQFDSASYVVREGSGPLAVTVQKTGGGTASVDFATADGTAFAGPLPSGDYQSAIGTLGFADATLTQSFPVTINDDAAFRSDRTFTITLSNPTGGAVLGARRMATVTIIDNDAIGDTSSLLTTQAPDALTATRVTLTVNLTGPPNAQWRLIGDVIWRDAGTTATGLAPGSYPIEFKPVQGFDVPIAPPIAVTAGGPNVESFDYTASGAAASGSLQVLLLPASVANDADVNARGQWRREGEIAWHDSGETLAGLNGGLYRIEFKPVSGFTRPPDAFVRIDGGPLLALTASYTIADAVMGAAPAPVPAADVVATAPYIYNGQIVAGRDASSRFGSGFVVRERVVLTAAHVVFDDATLSFTDALQWLAQKSAGEYEPEPLAPRGSYVFQGYAAQREIDGQAGVSSLAAFDRDVAALFFDRAAARGGFGGFLRSNAAPNEWLETSRLKMIVGYPVELPDPSLRGRLHATPAADLAFTRLQGNVFTTSGAFSYDGNSGGPLYVQENGTFYPAGVFIGGSGQTLVRAIDTEVVDLINRADTSANGGANSTGGGITLVQGGTSSSGAFNPAFVRCDIFPANAVAAGAAWAIDNGDFRPSGSRVALPSGPFTIRFKSVPGFRAPAAQVVNLQDRLERIIQATYVLPLQLPSIGGNLTRTAIRGQAFKYQITASNSPSSFAADPLPAGLALNIVSGVIAGTPAAEGQFTIALTATNTAGDGTATMTLRVLAPASLSVGVSGAGSVSPSAALGTTLVGAGTAVVLNAVPASGFIFDGWSGDFPTPATRNSFAMPLAANVTANFIPNPFRPLKGPFLGIISAPAGEGVGRISIILDPNGGFTGRLDIAGAGYPLRGAFTNEGAFVKAEDTSVPYALDLQLHIFDGAEQITGTVLRGASQTGTFAAARCVFASPPAQAGRYTIAFPVLQTISAAPAPAGMGYGAVTVTATGAIRFNGRLGDNTPVNLSALLTRNADWPFYFVPPTKTAYLAGTIGFRDQLATDLNGTVRWARQPGGTGPFAAGFTADLSAGGSRYAAPPFTYSSARLTLTNGPLATSLPIDLAIAADGRTITAPNGEPLTLTIARATGLFTGRYLPPGQPAVTIRGAALQKSNTAAGIITDGVTFGSATIEKQ